MIIPQVDQVTYQKFWEEKKLHILQSWMWGEVKKPEWNPLRVIITDYPVTILRRKIPFSRLTFGYIPRLFTDKIEDGILYQIKRYSQDQGLTHLLIDPNISFSTSVNAFTESSFKDAGLTVQPNQTLLIDLLRTTEELWLALKPKHRQKIHKAESLGCKVEVITSGKEAIDRFYPIMRAVTNRTEYIFHNREYLEKIWDEFCPLGLAKIFIVTHQNKDIAGYFLLYNVDTAYELYGGSNELGLDLQAGFLLKWRAILDAKEMRKLKYDQWGVSPKNESGFDTHHPMFHISVFKSGFGGEYIKFLPQQKIVFNSLGYSMYRLGAFLQKSFLKLKKL